MKKEIFATLMLFVASQGITAQEDEVVSVYQLSEVEVNANRATYHTPLAYTNLSLEDLQEKSDGQDVPYLLQTTPSVVATSDAGAGIGYTDLRLRGYDGTRISVTMNGVPMNESDSHKMYWVDTPDLISSSDEIQVQRGVGTSTVGSGAFGGAIHINSISSPIKFGGNASLSYGSFNTNKESVGLSSGLLKNHWTIDGRLSHIYSDGYMERATADMGSYMLQTKYHSGNTKLTLLSFGGTESTYNAWDGISSDEMAKNRRYNPCGEIQDKDGNVVGFYDDQKDHYLQINNHLSMSNRLSDEWEMTTTLHYTYGNGYYNQYKNNKSLYTYMISGLIDKDGNALKKSNLERQKSMLSHFGGVISSASYNTKNLSLNLGLSWNSYGSEHFGDVIAVKDAVNFYENFEYYRNNSYKHEGSAFAKMNLKVVKKFFVSADLQYRFVNQRIFGEDDVYNYATEKMQQLSFNEKFNFLNPKIGFNWQINVHNDVYASLAYANNEPTRKDFVNAVEGEEPLPERMLDFEMGYKLRNEHVSLGANLYYMWYKDQLILTGAQNPDTYEALYCNVDKSFRRGAELQTEVRPLKWLSVGGNITLSQNRVLDYTEQVYNEDTYLTDEIFIGNADLSYSPSLLWQAYANFHTHGFCGIWRTQYVGEQYITNSSNENLKMPNYCISQIELSYTLNLKSESKIRFGVSVNNIFNTKYCSNAFASSYIKSGKRYDEIYWFPQAGIYALSNVTINF